MGRDMRRCVAVLGVLVGAVSVVTIPAQTPVQKPVPPPPQEFKDLPAFIASLPTPASVPALDEQRAVWLTSVALSCIDELQARPAARSYFWQPTYRTVDAYEKTRAFYGCVDWPSAVGATWTLVRASKRFPKLGVESIIREKLNDHLGKDNLDGELAYLKDSPNFQRPYGWAWLLKLHAELATWKDPQAERWSASMTPLARHMGDALVLYFTDLDRPNRGANQTNTALSLNLILRYTDVADATALKRAVNDNAKRFFGGDTNCSTKTEGATAEIISPCLTEAVLMSRMMDQQTFVAWLDKFLPAPHSLDFRPVTSIAIDRPSGGRRQADPSAAAAAAAGEQPQTGGRGGRGGAALPPRAMWTALAFSRADAFDRLAAALPAADPRVALFRRLAAIHAAEGMKGLTDPATYAAPSVTTSALEYLLLVEGSRAPRAAAEK